MYKCVLTCYSEMSDVIVLLLLFLVLFVPYYPCQNIAFYEYYLGHNNAFFGLS